MQYDAALPRRLCDLTIATLPPTIPAQPAILTTGTPMRGDYLIDYLLESIVRERALLRRVASYMLPLLLLPVGFALAQMVRGWVGLIAGGLGATVLLTQIELFLRPELERARV